MIRLIQGRAQQIVHRRIDDDETLVVTVFQVDHAGQKRAIIGDNRPSRLESELEPAIGEDAADQRAIGGEISGRAGLVIDSDAAAKVECRHRQPFAAQGVAEIKKGGIGARERIEIEDLRADMNRQAGRPDMRVAGKPAIEAGGLVLRRGDTEFGGTLTGGNLGVRVGGNIDIDPQRHGRHDIAGRCHAADRLDLGGAFGVDLADAGIQRRADLLGGFANTRKDDHVSRHAGGTRAVQLTARDNVGAGTLGGQQCHHTKRRIGLQREMHLATDRCHGGGEIAIIGANAVA